VPATETPTPTPTASPTPDPAAEVQAIWAQAHAMRLAVSYEGATSDAAAFLDVADSGTADQLAALATAGRPDVATVLVDRQLDADIQVDVAIATIRDCVLVTVRAEDDAAPTLLATLWEGEARRLPEGWRLTSISRGADTCVPASLSRIALSAGSPISSAIRGSSGSGGSHQSLVAPSHAV